MNNKITEYETTQAAYMHYDGFRWQSGSILIAGVFVFWGVLASSSSPLMAEIVGISSSLVSIIMSVWILLAHHCKQIYLCKLHRLHELEMELSFEQHRRFLPGETEIRYRTYGLKGHNLDIAIYFFTSIGGPVFGWIKIGFSMWFLLPLAIVYIVTICLLTNETSIKEYLDKLKKTP